MLKRCLSLIVLALAAAGCSQGQPQQSAAQPATAAVTPTAAATPAAPTPAAAAPASSPPVDLTAVVRRAHFAFRREGSSFSGGHSSYRVSVEGARVSLTPGELADKAAPLVLETTRIARDSSLLAPGNTPAKLTEDGKLEWRSPQVITSIENRATGAELSWRFAERPAGTGDLQVDVAASGLELQGETSGGLHFKAAGSRYGVRFGHATWVDASGRRSDVPARWNGRQIALAVPANVIETSTYPAVLDPVIGPEAAVDVPVQGLGGGNLEEASVAYSGSQYLAVWMERHGDNQQVMGTRLSAGGKVLDPNGIAFTPPPSVYATSPSVVWDGTNFLVVWNQSLTSYVVVGRRLSPAGAMVDADPFVISEDTAAVYMSTSTPAAYNNGSTTLVAWTQQDALGYAIHAVRVDGASVTDSGDIVVAASATNKGQPRIGFGGGNWLIAWSDDAGDIRAGRVQQSTGKALDALAGVAVAATATQEVSPWVASNGADFLVTYEDTYAVYGKRVSSSTGKPLDATRLPICKSDVVGCTQPSVVYQGSSYQVVWHDSRGGLYGNRVSPSDGTRLDGATGALLAGSPSSETQVPRIFAAGSGSYVAWQQAAADGFANNLYGSRVGTTPSLLDAGGVRLTTTTNDQFQVRVASNGKDQWFVVWQDNRGGQYSIYGARIDENGHPIDQTGILLSGPGASYKVTPALAFNGKHYLVVWEELTNGYGIRGVRFDPATGKVVDPAVLDLYTYPVDVWRGPNVASDGDGWMLVWTDGRSGGSTADIYAGRVSAAGAPLDGTGFKVSIDSTFYQWPPRVSYGGGQYFVVWTYYSFNTGYSRVFGARVKGTTVLDNLLLGDRYYNASAGEYSVSFDGTSYLVTTEEEAPWGGDTLRITMVNAATGDVTTAGKVDAGSYWGMAGAYDGGQVILVHPDWDGYQWTVQGTRIGTDGAVLDDTDWNIHSGQVDFSLDVAALPGRALVAYSRFDGTPGVEANRLEVRLITKDLLGGKCALDWQCTSGHCVDGVCCNTACGGNAPGDCQACSVAAGAAVNGTCKVVSASHVCRDAQSVCDAVEKCDGKSTACPADKFTKGAECRPSAGGCDVAESCDGSGALCPPDTLAPNTTVCRASAGQCDVTEKCDGVYPECPYDYKQYGVVCRDASGGCDAVEYCDGWNDVCPEDQVLWDQTPCRDSVGDCDVGEVCDGIDKQCPADVVKAKGTACRASGGDCDLAESCNGVAGTCPNDAFAPASTTCRASAGDCDVVEHCSGKAPACPKDGFRPATDVCRALAGVCDVAEYCSGSGAACPSDSVKARNTSCRSAIGACDLPENCDGSSSSCPSDVQQPNGASCDDGDACSVNDTCSSGACRGVAALQLDATELDFADTPLGQTSAAQKLSFSNPSSKSLSIASIDGGAEFPTSGTPALPFLMVGHASEELSVAFAPAQTGKRQGKVVVTTTANDCKFEVSAQGVGLPAVGGTGQGGVSGSGGMAGTSPLPGEGGAPTANAGAPTTNEAGSPSGEAGSPGASNGGSQSVPHEGGAPSDNAAGAPATNQGGIAEGNAMPDTHAGAPANDSSDAGAAGEATASVGNASGRNGCGCVVVGASRSSSGAVWLPLALLLMGLRRRRAAQPTQYPNRRPPRARTRRGRADLRVGG